jgi:PAS domain S-box-containing protein
MNLRYLTLIPVVALAASIFVALFLDLSDKLAFNPPYLLLELNLIFWTIATVAIAFISAKSFTKEGSLTVLLLSCSIIIFGVSVIISGWAGTFSGNLSVAIGNIGVLIASIVQVLSGIVSLGKKQETKLPNRKLLLAAAYLGSIILVGAFSTMVLLGYVPMFFSASGPTILRQVVLGSAVFFFAVAAVIFGFQYLRSKSPSLYWYALAIGLFSIGLFSAFEVKALGDMPTWLGRATLYTGTVYLIASLLASRQKSGTSTDLATSWAESFRTNREQFAALFSNMLDAFIYCKIVVDGTGKPVDWVFLDVNEAYEQVTGLRKEQIVRNSVNELFPDEQKDPADWIGRYGRVALTGEPARFESYRKSLKRWLNVSTYSPKKGYFIAIFEDISKRKQAEEKLRESEQRWATTLSSIGDAIIATDIAGTVTFMNVVAEELTGWTLNEGLEKTLKQVFHIINEETRAEGDSSVEKVLEKGLVEMQSLKAKSQALNNDR